MSILEGDRQEVNAEGVRDGGATGCATGDVDALSMAEGASTNGSQQDAADGDHPLIFYLGPQRRGVNASALENAEFRTQLSAEIEAAPGPLVVEIGHLLEWAIECIWHVVQFLAGISRSYTVRGADAAVEHQTLFDAVLAMMVAHDDVARCGRSIRAALCCAVFFHPQDLSVACSRIFSRAKQLRIKGYTEARLLKHAQDLSRAVNDVGDNAQDADDQRVEVKTVFPDAPLADNIVIPPGWSLSLAGVAKAGSDDAFVIASAPVILTRRFTDIDGAEESVGVAWLRDGLWHEEIVCRSVIAEARTVVSLAGTGAPITSNTAKSMVDYLAAFEAVNLDMLPCERVTRRLGWQGPDGELGFLWGREQIAVQEPPTNLMGVTPETTVGADRVAFRGGDLGDEQLVDGFQAKGEFETWCQAVQPIAGFDKVRLAIYAALTAAMLRILGAGNIILSFAGTTSQGKTITLRIAASVWGCPDEKSPSAAISTFDSTRYRNECACEILGDLAMILDDTKRAQNVRDIAQTLYDVESGRSRARGSPDGMRRVGTFHTVLIMSGEAKATSFTEDGGTRARVLENWGSPFERANAETAALVVGINDAILEHHGHLGPRFVRYLVDHREKWAVWRDHFRRMRRHYERLAGNDSVAARMASACAAIRTTASLVHLALGSQMPWRYRDVVSRLWGELTSESGEADRAVVALRYVLSWARGHQNDFWPGTGASSQLHAREWVGRWDVGSGSAPRRPWEWIGILPHKLDEVLKAGGFEAGTIRRQWKDRGWLETSEGRGDRFKQRMGSGYSDLIAIRRTAIEELEGAQEEETTTVPFISTARQGTGT